MIPHKSSGGFSIEQARFSLKETQEAKVTKLPALPKRYDNILKHEQVIIMEVCTQSLTLIRNKKDHEIIKIVIFREKLKNKSDGLVTTCTIPSHYK